MKISATTWTTISKLLDEALDLEPAARTIWLERLQLTAPDLASSVQQLLAAHATSETADVLAGLPPIGNLTSSSAVQIGHLGLNAGDRVGPYLLKRELGAGGMADVWLAGRADGAFARDVALKLPRISRLRQDLTIRFARERDILARLEHPHIARLYDAGVTDDGLPYLAMEYVEGEAVDVYCRTRDLPLRERIELLLQVMAAVAHAHARLVVHRDLKPSNILVTKEGQVRLLDFGIAKLLEGEVTGETALTELSGRALTLDYASPEQIRGEPLDTASDVYSMAVVAFEVLAGSRPYRLKRASAAQLEEAIVAVGAPPASASAKDPSIARELRGDLDAILNKALKKSPSDRYQTMAAFARDLRRYLDNKPVEARPDGLAYRSSKFVRRYRLQVGAGALVSVALVVGMAVALWQAQVARQQEQRATLESDKQIAVAELYRETMTRLALLAKDEPTELSKPNAVTTLLQQQLQDRAPRFAKRPEQFAPQMLAVWTQLSFGYESEAALALGKEYLAYLKAHDAAAVDVIMAHVGLSRDLYRLQRFDESEAMRRAAIAWAPEAKDRATELSRLTVASDLANSLRARGKRDEALAVLTNAETLAAKKFPNEIQRFDNLRLLAVFWYGFDDSRALQAIEQAHKGYLNDGSANDDIKAQELLSFGNILSAEGRGTEAEAALGASRDVYARMSGRSSQNALRAIGPLANAIALQGDISRAERLLADTLHEVLAESGGSATAQTRELRRRRLDIAWLAGEMPFADELSADEVRAFMAPTAIRVNDALLFAQARVWTLTGRGGDATALLTALGQSRPDPGKPTLGWVQLLEQQAGAELATGDAAAALKTANALMTLLQQNDARSGRAYRAAAEMAALAASRLGDQAAATAALMQADGAAQAAYPSRVERAESLLRRSEILTKLGRLGEAASAAKSAQTDLVGQHAASPRLVWAQRALADATAGVAR